MKRKSVRYISFFLIFIILFLCLICSVPDEFSTSYQRAIVRQYDYFKDIKENKIVFIGGSCLAFGLDLDLMEELTGMPCALLGNHFSDGVLLQLEMAKSNLIPGDTVVIELMSYSTYSSESALLLSALGKRYDLHRFYPKEMLLPILEGYPAYFMKNLTYWRGWGYDPGEPYCLASFDYRGNMILERNECEIPELYSAEVGDKYGWADYYAFLRDIEQDFIDRLNSFSEYCAENGVSVYYTIPCYYEEAVNSEELMDPYNDELQRRLNAPLISRSKDYVFPREYIYDGIAHCTNTGAKKRTELLYRDLKSYLS